MYVLVDDRPGERLVLERRGLPPNLLGRIALSLMLLVPAGLAVAMFLHPTAPGVIFGAILLALAALFAGFGSAMGDWSRLAFDAPAGLLEARWAGFFLWGRSTTRIPFDRIVALSIAAGAEGEGVLDLTIEIGYRDGREKTRELSAPLRVRALDRRPEAMDLFFRVARILGWKAWRVRRSDPRRLDLEGARERRPGVRDLPAPGEAADYDSDEAVGRIADPGTRTAPFDPAKLGGRFKVAEWKPGHSVRVRRDPIHPMAAVVNGVGAAFVVAVVMFWMILPQAADYVPLLVRWYWTTVLSAGALAGVAAALASLRLGGALDVAFDWTDRRMTWREGATGREVPFDRLLRLVLRGWRKKEQETKGSGKDRRTETYWVYWCELEVHDTAGRGILAVTDETRDDPDVPYLASLPLAVDLAKSLEIPWRWMEYAEPSFLRYWRTWLFH